MEVDVAVFVQAGMYWLEELGNVPVKVAVK